MIAQPPAASSTSARSPANAPQRPRAARSARAVRLALRAAALAAGAAAAVLAAACLAPAPGLYDADEVRSIVMNRDRAAALAAPLVLLAHETTCHLAGSGPRETSEHRIWFIGDPDHPSCGEIARIRCDLQLERLELRRCRIYRGGDTLEIPVEAWETGAVRGWPEASRHSWIEAGATLPPLAAGDLVDIAYTVHNRWSAARMPANWEVFPLATPLGPTVERHVVLTHASVISGEAVVVGDPGRVIRHYGNIEPRFEVLTGNLPAAATDPHGPGAPRLLFSSETDWERMRSALAPHYRYDLHTYEQAFAAPGDSIVAAAPATRQRLAAALAFVDRRIARVGLPLAETRGFPRLAPAALEQRCADRLDRAVLVAAVARAARMKVDLYLAAGSGEAFRPDLPTPAQFDRVLLGVPLLEEGRTLLIDPWEGDLAAAERAAQGVAWIFGMTDDAAGFREVDEHGRLIPRNVP